MLGGNLVPAHAHVEREARKRPCKPIQLPRIGLRQEGIRPLRHYALKTELLVYQRLCQHQVSRIYTFALLNIIVHPHLRVRQLLLSLLNRLGKVVGHPVEHGTKRLVNLLQVRLQVGWTFGLFSLPRPQSRHGCPLQRLSFF
jgi:hypothetical protein